MDATIIAAPSSTKNESGKRDPEMHQTKKGNQWHFGMKAHIGANADSGLVHTVRAQSHRRRSTLKIMHSSDSATAYKHVQGLSRGLSILRAFCDCADGRAQIAELSALTGIHRTTVRRLLETLVAEGLVQSSGDDGAYFLTSELKRWGDAFTSDDHVAELATPILDDLSARITWPCSLATPQENTMIIRAATHHQSPLSFHRRTIGRRLPMLMTSMGRAYLAFSPASTRDRILDLIASKYDTGEVPQISLATFRQILLRTQRDGYGANHGEWSADKKVAAVALPVRNRRGVVLACINVVAITRATTPDQLAQKFLGQLQDAATAIEAAVAGSESASRARRRE